MTYHIVRKHFCQKCGSQLLYTAKKHHFDFNTGELLYYIAGKCPNKYWIFDSHNEYSTVEIGAIPEYFTKEQLAVEFGISLNE